MEIVKDTNYFTMNEKYTCDITHTLEAGNSNFHMHSYYEIFLLLEGNIHYFIKQSCYHMKSKDLLVVRNNDIHKAINLTKEPFKRLVIHINPEMIRNYSTLHTNLYQCFTNREEGNQSVSLSDSEYDRIYSLGMQLYDTMNIGNNENNSDNRNVGDSISYGQDIESDLILIQFLLLVNKIYLEKNHYHKPAPPSRVHRIMDYIDKHLTEDMTLDSIASAMALDKYHISHVFKSETQSSVFQYILVKRISLAKEMLQLGHTVTEACQLSGFNDYTNFIRSFKKVTGYTPGQYRKIYY